MTPAFATAAPLTPRHKTPPRLSPTRPSPPLPPRTNRARQPPRAVTQPAPTATAAAAPPSEADPHRLTAGVRARTVVHVCASGTLCTTSTRHAGVPFGTHVDYVLDDAGRPIFLLARNAMHTKNLAMQSRCSLFCQPLSAYGQDGGRATVVGSVVAVPEAELQELQDAYIHIHAHAADALQYPDSFSFYRMNVDDVFFVGGYGVVSQWVDAADFASAEPDPLAFDAPDIIASLNDNKEEDLKRLCKVFLDVTEPKSCRMTSLDRLGFDLRVRGKDGEFNEYRVAFREVVSNRFDVQSALVKAFQEAWERENGYDETWAGEDARATAVYYVSL